MSEEQKHKQKFLNQCRQSVIRPMKFNQRQHREAYVKNKAEKQKLRKGLGLAKDISQAIDLESDR